MRWQRHVCGSLAFSTASASSAVSAAEAIVPRFLDQYPSSLPQLETCKTEAAQIALQCNSSNAAASQAPNRLKLAHLLHVHLKAHTHSHSRCHQTCQSSPGG